jgi:hypothetical protein
MSVGQKYMARQAAVEARVWRAKSGHKHVRTFYDADGYVADVTALAKHLNQVDAKDVQYTSHAMSRSTEDNRLLQAQVPTVLRNAKAENVSNVKHSKNGGTSLLLTHSFGGGLSFDLALAIERSVVTVLTISPIRKNGTAVQPRVFHDYDTWK